MATERGMTDGVPGMRGAARHPVPPGGDVGEHRGSYELDALETADRFRLFSLFRRDDSHVHLWVLRALDQLRAAHVAQSHSDDVDAALERLAQRYPEAPYPVENLRGKLDLLAEDRVLYRVEDAGRAGSLERYRNRQSVYQFTDLGYFAYTAVESVLGARFEDANLSRLVFADILKDLRELAAANTAGDGDEVVRRLGSLDRAVEDMARRAARFHLTLGEIVRATDSSPQAFLVYKTALLSHMSDFMSELDRYLPTLSEAVRAVEASGLATLLNRAAEHDERPLMDHDEVVEDWRRRWSGLRAWFLTDSAGAPPRTEQLRRATRAAVSAVIALLRQIVEAQRGGVNRATELRHLAAWVVGAPDEGAAHALMGAAFNLRSARHVGGVHDDAEVISERSTWWDAPGVEVSVQLFSKGKAPTSGVPQQAVENAKARADLRQRQVAARQAEREAARALVDDGVVDRVLDEEQTRVVLRLLARALEARAVVAGRISGVGRNDTALLRLVPDEHGSVVRTPNGVLHLPGVRISVEAAGVGRARAAGR